MPRIIGGMLIITLEEEVDVEVEGEGTETTVEEGTEATVEEITEATEEEITEATVEETTEATEEELTEATEEEGTEATEVEFLEEVAEEAVGGDVRYIFSVGFKLRHILAFEPPVPIYQDTFNQPKNQYQPSSVQLLRHQCHSSSTEKLDQT